MGRAQPPSRGLVAAAHRRRRHGVVARRCKLFILINTNVVIAFMFEKANSINYWKKIQDLKNLFHVKYLLNGGKLHLLNCSRVSERI